MTYSAPMFVTAEFINNSTGEIKSQTVFMGDFPLMTDKGTFIINGTERVVVSQLVRSPGVYFDRQVDKTSDKDIYSCKVIPSRGAWLEFEIDKRDSVGVRIDRKRKQSVTVLLKALGWDEARILERFGAYESMRATLEKDHTSRPGRRPARHLPQAAPGRAADAGSPRRRCWRTCTSTRSATTWPRSAGTRSTRSSGLSLPIRQGTLTEDDIVATIEYLVRLHAGEEEMKSGDAVIPVETDDIDHFGNRRLRTVGELIQNQVRLGLARMERVVRERMTTQDVEAITPQTLINIRPVVASIKEFFGTSQLSQFMDQTNPLAGLTHKRRLSALGPGGLSRERAGFEVRDVHSSHYGRMCPIETPEGPNIGLIGSLSSYGRVNAFGFVETPYRKVKAGKVTDQIDYLTADEEDRHVIAQANAPLGLRRRVRRGPRAGPPQGRRGRLHPPGRGGLHGRLAAADGVRGHRDDPVPRARRRQPRPDGLEHAAPVGAAAAQRGPAGRHRHGVPRRRRRGRRDRGGEAGRGRGGLRRLRHPAARRRHPEHLSGGQVPPVQPGHLLQPEAHRGRGAAGRGRPGHRRRAVHRRGRDGARQEPARRVHAVGGPQLRGRDHPVPAARPGRRALLDPHRGARGRRARHQARARRRSPGTSRTSPRRCSPTSTTAASSGSVPRSSPATSWSARSRPRARPS